MARSSTSFKPKQSGNPKGRPKMTGEERKAAGFLNRMQKAEENLATVTEKYPDFDPVGMWETAKSQTNVTMSTEVAEIIANQVLTHVGMTEEEAEERLSENQTSPPSGSDEDPRGRQGVPGAVEDSASPTRAALGGRLGDLIRGGRRSA